MTKKKEERISPEEEEQITAVALDLIAKPATFTTGTWKCPVYKDAKGHLYGGQEIDLDEEEALAEGYTPALDANGMPLHAYCIEGAVNEATIRVLGPDRAVRLGAAIKDRRKGDVRVAEDGSMAELLGLNELTAEIHGDRAKSPSRTAMEFNDDTGDHKGVLKILRTKLNRVRKALGKEALR